MEQQIDDSEQLREQLDALLKQARLNQETMRRFNEQELMLIGITSLQAFISHLLYRLPVAFGLDVVSLLLIDPDHELAHLLTLRDLPQPQEAELIVDNDDSLVRQLYLGQSGPQLSRYQSEHHHRLFSAEHPPQSVALLPLLRGGELIGSLHFGSRDPSRYTPDSATDFLQRLAAISAVCLENCINHARLQQLGLTDPLTGVNNRRYFEQRLTEACAASLRHHRPLGCIFIDVDHFKRINDQWGHLVGDNVLHSIAHLVGGQLRHSDVLCRYGGEEFVVLLPDTPGEEAGKIAERIRCSIAEHLFEFPMTVTVSAGVAVMEQYDGTELELVTRQLVMSADAALYQAKEGGRDRVVIAVD